MILEEEPCEWDQLEPALPITITRVDIMPNEAVCLDDDLRKITELSIDAGVRERLQRGAPFTDRYINDECKHAQQMSISISEHIVDKAATPHLVRFPETNFPVDPFIDRRARPLRETQTCENDVEEEENLE